MGQRSTFQNPWIEISKSQSSKKSTTGKEFLALGGRITSETTLRQANKIVKKYDSICFLFVEQLVRKDMTVKRTMLGSLEVLAESDAATREAGAGQVYWATDPTGDNEETQAVFDDLDEREQSMVIWLQNTLTAVELYFSKEILDDDRLTDTLSAYLDKRDLGGVYSWADWNTTVMMDLVDDDALKVLETIVTIRREPNG